MFLIIIFILQYTGFKHSIIIVVLPNIVIIFIIMPPPLIGRGIKRYFSLTSVCRIHQA